MRRNTKRARIVGFAASAAFVGMPVAGVVGLPDAGRKAHAQSVGELEQALLDTEREIRQNDEQFAQQTQALKRESRAYKDARARHDNIEKEIRGRRSRLKDQVERARRGKAPEAAYAEKLDNTGDAIAAEKKKHAERMKNIPAGSMAAAEENERFEARMRELRARRDDVKEDRDDRRDIKHSANEYQRDVKTLNKQIEAENERHKRAMKYLPAYSPAAQEEQRFHEQRLREIQDGRELAGDRRDLTVAEKRADRAVDEGMDRLEAQIAEERARHARRMQETNAGSAAAAEENQLHARRMSELEEQKLRYQQRNADLKSSPQRAFELRRQLDDLDAREAAEQNRHARLLNEFDAGSPQVAQENERYSRVMQDLNTRRATVRGELAALGQDGRSASGR